MFVVFLQTFERVPDLAARGLHAFDFVGDDDLIDEVRFLVAFDGFAGQGEAELVEFFVEPCGGELSLIDLGRHDEERRASGHVEADLARLRGVESGCVLAVVCLRVAVKYLSQIAVRHRSSF